MLPRLSDENIVTQQKVVNEENEEKRRNQLRVWKGWGERGAGRPLLVVLNISAVVSFIVQGGDDHYDDD